MSRRTIRMYSANRFKMGLFALNCSGGLTMTKAPERWDASWDNNVTAAHLADAAGLEFLLPVGRWHGYRGETDTEGTSFETLTWASGLLSVTREVCIFGTLHIAFVNPIFAAKQIVTADHIGKGHSGSTSCPDGMSANSRCSAFHSRSTTEDTPTPKNG